ncbi:MAG: glycosyl hydrolase, partial [bacterium]|nr:glycosyl hydrolase [bacterium]
GSISPIDFLAELYRQGVGAYFDAVAFHPYSFPLPPEYAEQSNAWQQMENTTPSVRSVMAENGDSAKQIWITEYGAPTGGPGARATEDNYLSTRYADHVSEDWQARILTEALTAARGYPWIGPFFWYSYKDIGTSPATNENFFGLLRYDGSEKPAYAELKQAIAALP